MPSTVQLPCNTLQPHQTWGDLSGQISTLTALDLVICRFHAKHVSTEAAACTASDAGVVLLS